MPARTILSVPRISSVALTSTDGNRRRNRSEATASLLKAFKQRASSVDESSVAAYSTLPTCCLSCAGEIIGTYSAA